MIALNKNARSYSYLLLIITLLFSSCSTLRSHRALKPTTTHSKKYFKKINTHDRAKLVKSARSHLGRSQVKLRKKSFRPDCSGTIRGIFAQCRIPLGGILKNKYDNDVKSIYRYVKKYGKIIKQNPQPGDIVFFHNTYDRSRNGRMNDALTHIGIIEKISGSTIFFVHHLGRSIIRSRMNLEYPKKSRHPKTNHRINHMLRRAQNGKRGYTAGELFAGFGRL